MTILIVDDNEQTLYQIQLVLKSNGYKIITATNGSEALAKARKNPPDLIITDILMPIMDGFTLCREWRKDEKLKNIPFIFYTATYTHDEDREFALKLGADEFITKPSEPKEFIRIVRDVINKVPYLPRPKEIEPGLKDESVYLQEYNAVLIRKLEEKMQQLEEKNRELSRSRDCIKKGCIETVQRLTIAAEYRDIHTRPHLKRIGLYAKVIAEIMKLPYNVIESLYITAPIHDLGKIGIPDAILCKPGPLTPEEFEIIKKHTLLGAEILKGSESEILKMAEKITLYHHECWDGSGYPYGLKKEQIPLECRIVLLIDRYDAIRSERPYKSPFDHETAYRIITQGDAKSKPEQFDPQILEIFKKYHEEFKEIFDKNQ
ncbi:MAG: response regulator [bacterium]|nr:response regulator [bacterium]